MKFKNTLHTLIALFVLSIPFASYAQVVLWGQVPDGGNVGGGYGNIFSVTSTKSKTEISILKHFCERELFPLQALFPFALEVWLDRNDR